jgi:Zn-dependent peptidase ImmA (M78 family)/transcriptional regulator with XRE-family HTH domain
MPNEEESALIQQVARRIIDARNALDWSMRKLAREASMPASRLHRIETDSTRPIDVLDLARIAQALDVPLTRILRGSPVRDRVLTAARAQTVENATDSIARFIEVLELEDQFNEINIPDRQVLNYPSMPRGDVSPRNWGRSTAELVRALWGCPTGRLGDFAQLIEEKTGVYVAIDSMSNGVDGLSLVDPVQGTAMIATTTTELWERQRFTLAHELGHLIAGELRIEAVFEGQSTPAESAANEFARNLLLPWGDVVRKNSERSSAPWSPYDIACLAWEYQVSPTVAAIQLRRAGLAPDSMISEVAQIPMDSWSVIGGWAPEREGLIAMASTPRRPEGLVSRTRKGWQNGIISIRVFARVANESENDLRQALDLLDVQVSED